MSWTTVIWSAAGGICLAIAVVQFLVWTQSRQSWANLAFSVAALMVAIATQFELGMMHAATPEEYGRQFWWWHPPVHIMIMAISVFVYFHLGAGRLWLLWLLLTSRVAILGASLMAHPNLNFTEISGLRPLTLWGETVVVAVGTPRLWVSAQVAISTLLLAVFVLDASMTAWRRGERWKGTVIGGTFLPAMVLGYATVQMHEYGVLSVPFTLAGPFMIMVLGIAYVLSLELARASEVSKELERSQQRVKLATRAASLGMWDWDIVRDEIWANERTRARLGVPEPERITLERYLGMVHPDDRHTVRKAVGRAVEEGEEFQVEFRVTGTEGNVLWIAATGQVERDGGGKPLHLRGVSMDITVRKRAEIALQDERTKLAHVQRVTGLGQLSATLAHEINQPLASILRNAEAGELFLQQHPPDLEELQAILADIRQDDRRAVAVIERMRSLLKGRALQFEPLDLRELVAQTIGLLQAELQKRHSTLQVEVPRELPRVMGDRVHLQQVILNLVLNSMDAMDAQPEERRCIVVRAGQAPKGMLEVAVTDRGEGIPAEVLPHLFEPFVTSKPHGTGIGLAVSKFIVEMHGGRITAENNPDGGATIRFTLRAETPDAVA